MRLKSTRRVAGSLGIAAAMLLGGCADLTGPSTTVTASDPARITRTGFPQRLRPPDALRQAVTVRCAGGSRNST
jgi:hypothetical protein